MTLLDVDKHNTELLNFPSHYNKVTTSRVNTSLVAPPKPKTVEEWNIAVETAVQECFECLRTGAEIDWTRYSWVTRKTFIIQKAKALLKTEQDKMIDSVFTVRKGSVYQYLMLLCMLLGVLSGKPTTIFRDFEPKPKTVETTK